MNPPAPEGRAWIPTGPQKWDWESVDGMLTWIAARLVEAERSVPSGDGQSIIQQVIDLDLPRLRAMLPLSGLGGDPHTKGET